MSNDRKIYPYIPILFSKRICEKFVDRVSPVLRTRGIATGTQLGEVYHWLIKWRDLCTIWTATIQSPVPGNIYKVPWNSRNRNTVSLHDLQVHVDSVPQQTEGLINIEILNTHGINGWATYSDKNVENTPVLAFTNVLMFSGLGVTALAAEIEDLGVAELTGIWADEKLPGFLSSQRPEQNTLLRAIPHALHFHSNQTVFMGHVCQRCRGTGITGCPACGSTGRFFCNRCDGTGAYVNKGTCHKCNGSGRTPCGHCSGSGSVECFQCRGSGYEPVHYDTRTGNFSSTGRRFLKTNIKLYSFKHREIIPYDRTLLKNKIDSFVVENTLQANNRKSLDALCEKWAQLITCLERKRDAVGIYSVSPFEVEMPRGTLERKLHKGIYEFSFSKPFPFWLKKKEMPFPLQTQLNLYDTQQNSLLDDYRISLHRIDFERKAVSLEFPNQMDFRKIPCCFIIRPDVSSPNEPTLIETLSAWISENNYPNSILQYMAFRHEKLPAAELNMPEGHTLKPTQVEAIRNGVTNYPISLIKGPPGTGKTTVIVEIIMQALKAGKRILVSSQTHQAVGNVVEKLHQIGNIPMLRHARDTSKLGEIEKQYLTPYTGDEIEACHAQSRKKLDAAREQMDALTTDMTAIEDLREKLETLEMTRKDFLQNMQGATEQNRSRCARIQTICDRQYMKRKDKAQRTLKGLNDRYEKEEILLRYIHTYLTNLNQQIKELRHRIDHADNSGVKKLSSQLLGSWTPFFLSDTEQLTKFYSEAHTKKRAAQTEILRIKTALSEIQQKITKCHSVLEYQKDRLERFCRLGKDRYAQILTATQDRHRKEYQAQEDLLCKAAKEGIDAVKRYDTGVQKIPTLEQCRCILKNLSVAEMKINGEIEFCQKWLSDIEEAPEELPKFLRNQIRVFCSTCTGLSGWRDLHLYGVSQFDISIVDEAGHATIPETIIPLAKSKRTILIGDDQQLPPIIGEDTGCRPPTKNPGKLPCVRSGKDSVCWLESSLFGDLWNDHALDLPRAMLNWQFRMHPDIANFVSNAFYEGKVKDGVKENERQYSFAEFQRPVCLIDTKSYGRQRHESCGGRGNTSYINVLETRIVKRILEHLLSNISTGEGGEKITVGVISPYSAQTLLLQNELTEFFNAHTLLEFSHTDVASVDRFQGSERDIMIISFTRSPKPCQRCQGTGEKESGKCPSCQGNGYTGSNLRFVHDIKRMNVAFSRARCQLIMVGDIETLCNGRGTEEGRQILSDFHNHVLDRGRVLRVWEKGEF